MVQTSYDCPICRDTEIDARNNPAKICECSARKRMEKILKKSGISEAFQKIGFNQFNPTNDVAEHAKQMAIDYVKQFEQIEHEQNNSIAFLGNAGSGKTHLSIAIVNNLLSKNIAVLYMPYREVITEIKQNMTDEESYNKIMSNYKTARVLLIDDLFKGRLTESDINIMFDIVNHRYLKQSPMIISSEFTPERLIDFDEAIGSRIIQMCKGRISEFIGRQMNYRLQ